MAKPLVHARSSARRFGGQMEEYIELHQLMDSSKAAIADNRHRTLTHQAAFGFVLEEILGKEFQNSAGRSVSIRDLAEQHITEDHKGCIPTVADYLRAMPLEDWMGEGLDEDLVEIHTKRTRARLGGEAEEHRKIHALLHYGEGLVQAPRWRALTHHSFGVHLAQLAFGDLTSSGISVREIATRHIEVDLGRALPDPGEWLDRVPYEDWHNNGVPPSARQIEARRRRKARPKRPLPSQAAGEGSTARQSSTARLAPDLGGSESPQQRPERSVYSFD